MGPVSKGEEHIPWVKYHSSRFLPCRNVRSMLPEQNIFTDAFWPVAYQFAATFLEHSSVYAENTSLSLLLIVS